MICWLFAKIINTDISATVFKWWLFDFRVELFIVYILAYQDISL